MLGKVFGPREKVKRTAGQHCLRSSFAVCSPHQVLFRWSDQGGGHVLRVGEKRDTYRILKRKPEGNKQLGRPRHRCEDNIKMDRKLVEFVG
jgi:hypothetical protein